MISFSTCHHLLVVGLEVARRLRLAAEDLDGIEHRALVGDDRFAQRARPVEVGAHRLHDVGVVQQRLDRVVPLVVDGELGIGLALVEEAVRLHQLQRIGRGRQDDRDQIVRIERDRADERVELLGGRRRRRARPGPPAPARRRSARRRARRFRPAVHARTGRRGDPRRKGKKSAHHACSMSWLCASRISDRRRSIPQRRSLTSALPPPAWAPARR